MMVLRIKDRPGPALDKWSVVHTGAGFAMGVLGFPRPVAYSLILLVEIFEFIAAKLGSKFFRESGINTAVDIGIGIAAYEIGRLAR